jgi:hypothetical protein
MLAGGQTMPGHGSTVQHIIRLEDVTEWSFGDDHYVVEGTTSCSSRRVFYRYTNVCLFRRLRSRSAAHKQGKWPDEGLADLS